MVTTQSFALPALPPHRICTEGQSEILETLFRHVSSAMRVSISCTVTHAASAPPPVPPPAPLRRKRRPWGASRVSRAADLVGLHATHWVTCDYVGRADEADTSPRHTYH